MGLDFKHSFNHRLDSKNDDESRSVVFFCSDNQASSFLQRNNLWKLNIWLISGSFFCIYRFSLLFILFTCWLLTLSIFLGVCPWDFSKCFVSSTGKNSDFWFILTSLIWNMRNLFNTIKVNLSLLLFKLVFRIIWVFEIPDVNHCIESCWDKAEIIIEPTDWLDFSSMVFEDHVRSAFACIKVKHHDWVCIGTCE